MVCRCACALVVLALAAVAGCPAARVTPCNVDADCEPVERCAGGFCNRVGSDPTADAGEATDAGDDADAGNPLDAGDDGDDAGDDAGDATDDAGDVDAGDAADAGGETDAGEVVDAGGEPDAGVDPGPPWQDLASPQRLVVELRGDLLAATATGLVVPIVLTGDLPAASTTNDGRDVRVFVDDVALAHEIEVWDPSGTSVVWVRVPTLPAGERTQLHLYFGNTVAVSTADAAATWTGYDAVFHLGDSVRDVVQRLPAPNVTGTSQVAGKLGRGRLFDGVNDTIHFGAALPVLRGVSSYTLSAWVRLDDGFAGDRKVISLAVEGSPTTTSRAGFQLDDRDILGFARSVANESERNVRAVDAITVGVFQHVALVVNVAGDTMTVFLDGVQIAQASQPFNQSATSSQSCSQGAIGTQDDGGSNTFDGVIDEVRVLPFALDANAIAAEHLAGAGTLVELGALEARP